MVPLVGVDVAGRLVSAGEPVPLVVVRERRGILPTQDTSCGLRIATARCSVLITG